jgi:hypothetical protein
LLFLPPAPESDFLVTEFPTPRPELGDRVAVVVIANAGHALIREQPAAVSGGCHLDEAPARLRGS